MSHSDRSSLSRTLLALTVFKGEDASSLTRQKVTEVTHCNKDLPKHDIWKLKVFVDKHSCFGNYGCHQLKTIHIRYSQNNLYNCHKSQVMFQDKRSSLLLIFVKTMKLLALICLNWKALPVWPEVEVTEVTQCFMKKDLPKQWQLVKKACS